MSLHFRISSSSISHGCCYILLKKTCHLWLFYAPAAPSEETSPTWSDAHIQLEEGRREETKIWYWYAAHIAILKLQCKSNFFSNTVPCFYCAAGIVTREVASLNSSSLMQRSYSHQSTAYVTPHHLTQYDQDNSCQISYHQVWIALTLNASDSFVQ